MNGGIVRSAMPNLTEYPMTAKQAGAYVGVHEDTIKRWAADGKVRAFRTPGKWWRFSQADLDAFLTPSPIDTDEQAAS